jgi:hypothetical protein
MMPTIPNLPALKQRLNQLNLQKAQYGISADPHITIEAQNLETVVQQMGLIEIQRGNLAHLLKQRGQLGTHTPPHIAGEIQRTRREIERLRAVCRNYGHAVTSHPLDSDEPETQPDVQPVPVASDPLNVIREKLEDLDVMLRRGKYDEARAIVRELRALL